MLTIEHYRGIWTEIRAFFGTHWEKGFIVDTFLGRSKGAYEGEMRLQGVDLLRRGLIEGRGDLFLSPPDFSNERKRFFNSDLYEKSSR
jgi:hypothetical protein